VFDQDLGVVLWDLKAPKTVIVQVKTYQGTKELDTETLTLDPVQDMNGLYFGKLKTRLTDAITAQDQTLQGSETTDTIEITYNAAGTPLTVNISEGVVESYAGAVEASQVKADEAMDHFKGAIYQSIVGAGLPYHPAKADDKAYRLWPGAA